MNNKILLSVEDVVKIYGDYTALNNANIKFNQFDFDIDRYVIDSTTGNSNEQYLLFHNYEYNV